MAEADGWHRSASSARNKALVDASLAREEAPVLDSESSRTQNHEQSLGGFSEQAPSAQPRVKCESYLLWLPLDLLLLDVLLARPATNMDPIMEARSFLLSL